MTDLNEEFIGTANLPCKSRIWERIRFNEALFYYLIIKKRINSVDGLKQCIIFVNIIYDNKKLYMSKYREILSKALFVYFSTVNYFSKQLDSLTYCQKTNNCFPLSHLLLPATFKQFKQQSHCNVTLTRLLYLFKINKNYFCHV